MASLAIAFFAILSLHQLFHFQNKRRDRQQGVQINPESREATEPDEIIVFDKDETDWENPTFRYYL